MTLLSGFDAVSLPFSDHPLFGSDHPFATPVEDAGKVSACRDRSAAARAVGAANPLLPAPPPEADYVVAGQQPVLLTGPLFVFLKGLTAVVLAERLSRREDRPILPLFWVASEDHDILEVNRVTLSGRRYVASWEGSLKRGNVPQVGEIPLTEERDPLLLFLEETLPSTEFKGALMGRISEADFSDYATLFTDLMRALFSESGLRFIDPRTLRNLSGPVLADLAERWKKVETAFREGSDILRREGVKPPLSDPGLFAVKGGNRQRLEVSSSLAEEIRCAPENYSPGAALRPVLQDAVLPVRATVAGPTEMLYLRQVGPIHAVVGGRASAIVPRISATFLEDKIATAARKEGLEGAALLTAEPVSVEEEKTSEDRELIERGEAFLEAVKKAAPPGWEKGARALRYHVEKLTARAMEERTGRGARLRKIRDALLPGGRPQERVENIHHFLCRYGSDFVARALQTFDPDQRVHWLVRPGRKKECEE